MEKIKLYNMETTTLIKAIIMVIIFTSLLIYAFYVHKDEPHWFERRYVKIIK